MCLRLKSKKCQHAFNAMCSVYRIPTHIQCNVCTDNSIMVIYKHLNSFTYYKQSSILYINYYRQRTNKKNAYT